MLVPCRVGQVEVPRLEGQVEVPCLVVTFLAGNATLVQVVAVVLHRKVAWFEAPNSVEKKSGGFEGEIVLRVVWALRKRKGGRIVRYYEEVAAHGGVVVGMAVVHLVPS